MTNKQIHLNMGHLLPDTIHILKDNGFTGLFVQFTTDSDILITIDTDIINTPVLTSDVISRVYDIPDDLRLCLYYALDHNADQIFFNKGTNPTPLLPAYTNSSNTAWDNYLVGVQYNGVYIQGKNWPGELIPD